MMIVVVGILVLGVLLSLMPPAKPRFTVSDKCREIVALADGNVDAWRYINTECSVAEQDALRSEGELRGWDTSQLDKARAARR